MNFTGGMCPSLLFFGLWVPGFVSMDPLGAAGKYVELKMKSQKEKLIESIRLYIRKNELDSDTCIYEIDEWLERGEEYLNESEFVIISEGGLNFILNFGDPEEFYDLIESFGYYMEMGHSWSYGFYFDEELENTNSLKSMTYSEKLRDERWKNKRLQVKEDAENKCEDCGSSNNLEVHHCYYKYGLEPWQYPLDALKCLCSSCHEKRGKTEMILRARLADLNTNDLETISNLIVNGLCYYSRKGVMNFINAIGHSEENLKRKFDQLLKSRK